MTTTNLKYNHSSCSNWPMVAVKKSVLDDLCCRFIVNMPDEQLNNPVRVCFQIELAYWFYVDYFDEEVKKCSWRDFIRSIFLYLPRLQQYVSSLDSIIEQWRQYKSMVPTYGAVLLDKEMENVVLVQGEFAKSSWGFPKGKVNENELPHRCAIRETLEETGYDISPLIDKDEYFERKINNTTVRLYPVTGVDKKFPFSPLTRNEIRRVLWFRLDHLPDSRTDESKNHFGMYAGHFLSVVPFVRSIRDFVRRRSGLSPLLPRGGASSLSVSPAEWTLPLYEFADWSIFRDSARSASRDAFYSSPNFRNSAHPLFRSHSSTANKRVAVDALMNDGTTRTSRHGANGEKLNGYRKITNNRRVDCDFAALTNQKTPSFFLPPPSTNENAASFQTDESRDDDAGGDGVGSSRRRADGEKLSSYRKVIDRSVDFDFATSIDRKTHLFFLPPSSTNENAALFETDQSRKGGGGSISSNRVSGAKNRAPFVVASNQRRRKDSQQSTPTSAASPFRKSRRKRQANKQRLNFDALSLNDKRDGATTKTDSASESIRLVEKWNDVRLDWARILGDL